MRVEPHDARIEPAPLHTGQCAYGRKTIAGHYLNRPLLDARSYLLGEAFVQRHQPLPLVGFWQIQLDRRRLEASRNRMLLPLSRSSWWLGSSTT